MKLSLCTVKHVTFSTEIITGRKNYLANLFSVANSDSWVLRINFSYRSRSQSFDNYFPMRLKGFIFFDFFLIFFIFLIFRIFFGWFFFFFVMFLFFFFLIFSFSLIFCFDSYILRFFTFPAFWSQIQISSRPELFSNTDTDLGFAGIFLLQIKIWTFPELIR